LSKATRKDVLDARLRSQDATLADLYDAIKATKLVARRRDALQPIINRAREVLTCTKSQVRLDDVLNLIASSPALDDAEREKLLAGLGTVMTLTGRLPPPLSLPSTPNQAFQEFLGRAGPDAEALRLLALYSTAFGWQPQDIDDDAITRFAGYVELTSPRQPSAVVRVTIKAFNSATLDVKGYTRLTPRRKATPDPRSLRVSTKINAEITDCGATLKNYLPEDLLDPSNWAAGAIEARRGPHKRATTRQLMASLRQAVVIMSVAFGIEISTLGEFRDVKTFRALRVALKKSEYSAKTQNEILDRVMLMLQDWIKVAPDEALKLIAERKKLQRVDGVVDVSKRTKIYIQLAPDHLDALRGLPSKLLAEAQTAEKSEGALVLAQAAVAIALLAEKPFDTPDFRELALGVTLDLPDDETLAGSIFIPPARRWNKIKLAHTINSSTCALLRSYMALCESLLGRRVIYLFVNIDASVKAKTHIGQIIRNALRANGFDLTIRDFAIWHALEYLRKHPDDFFGCCDFIGRRRSRGVTERFNIQGGVNSVLHRHTQRMATVMNQMNRAE
jgi:hypothetical protein